MYINYLVEKDNKNDLNNLVENILIQDISFKSYYEKKKSEISNLTIGVEKLLSNYLQLRTNGLEIQRRLKELGTTKTIAKSIEKIQQLINESRKLTSLSPEEYDKYNKLLTEKSNIEKQIQEEKLKDSVLKSIVKEIYKVKEELFGLKNPLDDFQIKGKIDRILDQFANVPSEINIVYKQIFDDFQLLTDNLKKKISDIDIEKKQSELNNKISKTISGLAPYNKKIAGQEDLKRIMENLAKEKIKYEEANNLEKQIDSLSSDYVEIRKHITSLLKKRYDSYLGIVDKVNETKSDIGSEVCLNCTLLFNQTDFPLYHNVNRAAIYKGHYYDKLFSSGFLNYNIVPSLFSKALKVKDGKLTDSKDIEFPLRRGVTLEEILKGLISDYFTLDYSVTYRGDELLNMSPGKKGTVLLILFLHISSSNHPILIDQPEDNLDNRTIYDLLCQMIKEKKKERQIIIVSHNANLVVSTDAENIIVANQEGQDSIEKKSLYKFEYINGSIEHSFPKDENINEILLQQGIKEHICDILEGGEVAFKQRERKYSIKENNV